MFLLLVLKTHNKYTRKRHAFKGKTLICMPLICLFGIAAARLAALLAGFSVCIFAVHRCQHLIDQIDIVHIAFLIHMRPVAVKPVLVRIAFAVPVDQIRVRIAVDEGLALMMKICLSGPIFLRIISSSSVIGPLVDSAKITALPFHPL